MNISIFRKFNEVVENKPITDILKDIKEGLYEKEVLKIRDLAMADKKEEADNLKKRLLAFTPSGLYEGGRKPEFLKEYSGFIILDIDKLKPDRVETLFLIAVGIEYSYSCFRSPSGLGFKILVRVNSSLDQHVNTYNLLADFYEKELGISMDRSGKDVSRLCFMSFDPNLYLNEDSVTFEAALPDSAIRQTNQIPEVDFKSAFKTCIDFTEQKEDYNSGNRNNYIHLLAHNCNREGIPRDMALDLITANYDLPEKEIENTVNSAYSTITEHNTKKRKPKLLLIDKIEQFLTLNYAFRFNEVTGRLEVKKRTDDAFEPVTDYIENSVLRNLMKNNIRCNQSTLRNILNSNFCPTHNPFIEYFNTLPPWDGCTDYISQLAGTITTTQQDLWLTHFKKWLVALVATAIDPKVINHTVIVLTGGQGIGKTTWSLKLVPAKLMNYVYSGSINPNNKDTLVHLTECILINLDELENLNRTEIGSLKEMITKSHIRMRRAYGHNNESLVRRASFIGSVNTSQFLNDSTGSRRFLCFEIKTIQYEFEIDLDLVYAQALQLFRDGFRFWFDKSEVISITTNNEQYQIRTVEEELLLSWFRKPKAGEYPHYLSASQVLSKLSSLAKINATTGNVITLGKALRKHGYERVKKGGAWVYPVIELTWEQVESENNQAPGNNTEAAQHTEEQGVPDSDDLPF
jgi:predicted P-loop ATPase